MIATFTKDDQDFLKSVGISVEPTRDEVMLALAQRIAKHTAPGRPVKVDPDEAKRQLIRFALRRLLEANDAD